MVVPEFSKSFTGYYAHGGNYILLPVWEQVLSHRFAPAACCLSQMTSAMPPRMAAEAKVRRRVIGSPRKTMPPKAASTGTLSCTVAALVAFKAGKTVYQTA